MSGATRAGYLLCAVVCLALCQAWCGVGFAQVAGPRLIAVGWDDPTPASFRQHIGEFERWPFDGAVVRASRRVDPGGTVPAHFAFSREHWTQAEFEPAVAELRAAHPRTATHNFLLLNANPGDVDWFDDAGWREVVEHWRLLAWVVRQAGFRGLAFDPEPYIKPHEAFNYQRQSGRTERSFVEYAAQARKRGREVGRAIAAEFPGITIFAYRLLCDLVPQLLEGGDPSLFLATEGYGLVPAFVDGWLDELPASTMLVEGNERAYSYTSDAEFHRAYSDLRLHAQRLIATEHRAKFRTQYTIGHGIYLDTLVGPKGASAEGMGASAAARLQANVAAGLRTSDAFVWIYGEHGRWWPGADPSTPSWTDRIPGADRALRCAKDPVASARIGLAKRAGRANLVLNPGFEARGTDGLPQHWLLWQASPGGTGRQSTRIRFDGKASAHAVGTENGCFMQGVQVEPGASYAVSAWVRHHGKGYSGILVQWKAPDGSWLYGQHDVVLERSKKGDGRGFHELTGLASVPPGATQLVLLLLVRGQYAAQDQTWFDGVRVVKIP